MKKHQFNISEPEFWKQAYIEEHDARIEDIRRGSMNWISVEERLPELMKMVLVTDGRKVSPAWLMEGVLIGENGKYNNIWVTPFPDFGEEPITEDVNKPTNWMPLPEPPKEADND